MHGTQLAKLLISGMYLQELITEFLKGRELFREHETDPSVHAKLKGLLKKAQVFDPQRIEQVQSLSQFRDALYGLSCLIYYTVKEAAHQGSAEKELGRLAADMNAAYSETFDASVENQRPFDVRSYLGRIQPILARDGLGAFPVLGDDIFLYELKQAFNTLYALYREFEEAQTTKK